MIVPMKQVAVAMLAADVPQAVEALADLAAVHVEFNDAPDSVQVAKLAAQKDTLTQALALLGTPPPEPPTSSLKPQASSLKPHALAQSILAAASSRDEAQTALARAQALLADLSPLGGWSANDFRFLANHGVTARVVRVREKGFDPRQIPVPHAVAGQHGPWLYILCADTEAFDLPLDLIPADRHDPAGLMETIRTREAQVREAEDELARLARFRPVLAQALPAAGDRLAFARVAQSMPANGPVRVVTGYCPKDRLEALEKAAKTHSWALAVRDAPRGPDTPTLLKHSRPIRLLQPLLKFLGTLPGYDEQDVSPWFLASLTVFFAMLVGDAGYGLVFLGGILLARAVSPRVSGRLAGLLTLFSLATVAWGAASGVWFGHERVASLPGFRGLIVPEIYGFGDNRAFLMHLCFVLGAIHLSLAHAVRAAFLFPGLETLAEAGWIVLVWALFSLSENLVLGNPLPGWFGYALAGGGIPAALFSRTGKPWWKSMAAGLADLPLALIRAFSDVISYVRLFAVGFASLVVAVSVNGLAAQVNHGTLPTMAAAALVLAVGHSVNIALCSMGVLVHGVRLNMLEFSSHAHLSWSGRPFSPLSRRPKGEAS